MGVSVSVGGNAVNVSVGAGVVVARIDVGVLVNSSVPALQLAMINARSEMSMVMGILFML